MLHLTNRTRHAAIAVTLAAAMAAGLGVMAPGAGSAQAINNAQPDYFVYTALGWTWTLHDFTEVEPSGSWTDLASSADGTRLIVVNGGSLWTSSDSGLTWSARTPAGTGPWETVISSADGAHLLAFNGANQLWASSDGGVSWTQRNTSLPPGFVEIISSSSGAVLAGRVLTGTGNVLYISSDGGTTWQRLTGPEAPYWNGTAISGDGTTLFVAAPGELLVSTDGGLTWAQRPFSGMGSTSRIISSPDGSRLSMANGTQLYTSADGGLTWAQRDLSSGAWSAMAFSADGGTMTAMTTMGQVYISDDSGSTWSARYQTSDAGQQPYPYCPFGPITVSDAGDKWAGVCYHLLLTAAPTAAPTTVDHSFTTPADQPITITADDLRAGSTWSDGSTNWLVPVDLAASLPGAVTNQWGSVTWAPTVAGTVSFPYKLRTPNGIMSHSATAAPSTVSIAVTPASSPPPPTGPPTAPTAADHTFTIQVGKPITISATELRAGSTWSDGSTGLLVPVASIAALPGAVANPDGSVSWTPTAAGEYSFPYELVTPNGVPSRSAPSVVGITVTPAPPTGPPDPPPEPPWDPLPELPPADTPIPEPPAATPIPEPPAATPVVSG